MATPYMGELRIMAFNFPPKNWAMCNGQLLSIQQNQALFSLLGTTYGGNGVNNFALPDLRTRVPAHIGQGLVQGEVIGQYAHTLLLSEMPQHVHFLSANSTVAAADNKGAPAAGNSLGQSTGKPKSGPNFDFNVYAPATSANTVLSPYALTMVGQNQPHENRQPYLALTICISLSGIFPSRN